MKTWFLNLSLSKKLILLLVAVGLIPMIIASFIAIQTAKSQLKSQAFSQLEAVREIKGSALKRYFATVEDQLVTLSHSETIVNAMAAFGRSFFRLPRSERLEAQDIAEYKLKLKDYYINQFGKKYQKENDGKKIDFDGLLNNLSNDAIVAQYMYIANNSNPLGEKHLLDFADGRAVYHNSHKLYHPSVREFLEKFGFYDIFLVDANTGVIVYSVFKELDYGTSLIDGPYANTNFAAAFTNALKLEDGQAHLTDFRSYTPSYEAPASFISTPIFNRGEISGVLIFQMPMEPINAIMSERSGMGETGDSYLVGEDFLMRSDSFLDSQYRTVTRSFRNPAKGSVKTLASSEALEGKKGNKIIKNFSNEHVLSSYAAIELPHSKWAIIAEIEQSEALAGIQSVTWTITIFALIGAIVIGFFALVISRITAAPILELSNTIQQVEKEGNFRLMIKNNYKDEIGQTARAFNQLIANLNEVISGTNSVLDAMGKNNYGVSVSSNYSGQLGILTQGVNDARNQIKKANIEQEKQAERAHKSAQDAQHAAEKAQAQAEESLVIKQALDVSATAVMITDAELNIVYQNDSAQKLMSKRESEIRKALPSFNANNILGSSFSTFITDNLQRDAMLQSLKSDYSDDLKLADLTFKLNATPITDQNKRFLGSVVEWVDTTEALIKEIQERRIANENSRIRQALDSSSTGALIADTSYKIIYTNNECKEIMRSAQGELQKVLGSFDANNLVNSNLMQFYTSGKNQRKILDQLTTTHHEEMVQGKKTFSVSSTPIINGQNERIGTVVEWRDRSDEVAIEKEIDNIIDAASKGNFGESIDLTGKTGFFRTVSESLNNLLSTTNVALADIMRIFSALANGDLSQTISKDYEGEFAQLKSDANNTVIKLDDIISNIRSASTDIARGASEISSGNASLSHRTEQQASSLEVTASNMEEMISIVRNSEENAQAVNELADRSVQIAREGNQSVLATSAAMKDITLASTKISNIIGVIDEIAFQTNLLALNAAVEAARAGEQGRGFAVVASEVRNLAQRSANAAKEIKTLIEDSVHKVEQGSSLVNESEDTLKSIVTEIEEVGNMMADILNSAKKQTTGIEQVNQAVSQMDQMTQENAALVEQASAASESMADQAHKLDQLVSFFK